MRRISSIATLTVLTACATQMTSEGSKVELLTEQQASRCEQIKVVTVNQRLGPDKPGNATVMAIILGLFAGRGRMNVSPLRCDFPEGWCGAPCMARSDDSEPGYRSKKISLKRPPLPTIKPTGGTRA